MTVAAQQFVWGSTVEDPIVGVLCGSFTGPGSVAMAVSFSAPTCWAPQGWAVYRQIGASWQLVLDQPLRFVVGDLVDAGGAIRETVPIRRADDPRCLPSGGTQARTWTWDGTRLVPGPWERITPPAPRVQTGVVFSPLPVGLSCSMVDDGTDAGSHVYCWVGRGRARDPHARLNSDGSFDRVRRQRLPTGLGGPSLRFGRSVTVGRFRCRSTRAGMRCTVRNRGFRFDRRGAHRIGGRAAASAVRFDYFKTPSGNIVCQGTTGVPDPFVACAIKSGLNPAPPPVECEFGSPNLTGISLGARGRASVGGCSGDPGPLVAELRARVLAHGRTWRRGGFRCRSSVRGLTCRNRAGRGFFLSRERWRRV
jgi:hypothetical protein